MGYYVQVKSCILEGQMLECLVNCYSPSIKLTKIDDVLEFIVDNAGWDKKILVRDSGYKLIAVVDNVDITMSVGQFIELLRVYNEGGLK